LLVLFGVNGGEGGLGKNRLARSFLNNLRLLRLWTQKTKGNRQGFLPAVASGEEGLVLGKEKN